MQDGKVKISEDLMRGLVEYLLQRPCGEVIELVNRLLIEIKGIDNQNLKENEVGKSVS